MIIYLAKLLEHFAIYRQISRLTILHTKFVLLELHLRFMSPDFNALSTQRVCISSISTLLGVVCLSLEVLYVKGKELRGDSEEIFRSRLVLA